MNETKLKACGLWKKTSAGGNCYFVGRLGGVRILIFENRDRQGDGDPTHHLYFAEAPDRPRSSGTGERPQAAAAASLAEPAAPVARRRRRPAPYRHLALAAPTPAAGVEGDLNDEIPF